MTLRRACCCRLVWEREMDAPHQELTVVPSQLRRTGQPREGSGSTKDEFRPQSPTSLAVPVPARPFQGEPAGIVSRLLANAIDVLTALAAVGLGYLGLSGLLFL